MKSINMDNFCLTTASSATLLSDVTSISAFEPIKTIDYDDIFQEVMKRLNIVPTMEHKCNNCGGTLEMRADEHIFKCPYCRSAYAIGTTQLNSRY